MVLEDTFIAWKEDQTDVQGKRQALLQTKCFLTWLAEAEEEESDDDDVDETHKDNVMIEEASRTNPPSNCACFYLYVGAWHPSEAAAATRSR